LCGYEGEHQMPADWRVYSWVNFGGSKENKDKERIWFSPHCLP
jgi:hypothetical protein